MNEDATRLERLWDTGQQHLVAGRYKEAHVALLTAASISFHLRDAGSLARITLPLLEAARQVRQHAVEGPILITGDPAAVTHYFSPAPAAGTIILRPLALPTEFASIVAMQKGEEADESGTSCLLKPLKALIAQNPSAAIEYLFLHHRGGSEFLAPADLHDVSPTSLAVRIVDSPAEMVDPDNLATVPLPAPGLYLPSHPLHPVARESLLVAWEALALRWQSKHPLPLGRPSKEAAWAEVAWLRQTLVVDPACEPVAMRLIALAESIKRA